MVYAAHKLRHRLHSIAKNGISSVKKLRHAEHRQKIKTDLKYKWLLFERRWQLHPLFRFTYPKPGLPRRITIVVLAFIITGVGFLAYMNAKAQADWYSTSWVYRKTITINHTKVPSTQTNFPVLITTTDTSLAANAQQLGEDILFTSSDGTTKLSHEIESYASASGKLVAWVKIPSLSSTADTTIYMYYGNPSAPSQQNAVNVWDNNYAAVYHMKENPTTTNCPTSKEVCDSTSNVNNFDNNNLTASSQTTGQVDGALDFNGTTQYLQAADAASNDITGSITVSAWIKADDTSSFREIVVKDGGTTGIVNYGFQVDTNNMNFYFTDNTGSGGTYYQHRGNTAISPGTWYYASVTYDTANVRQYLNGNPDGVTARTVALSTENGTLKIGSNQASEEFDGTIDEVRISNTIRSADWTKTEYNNQATPSAFFTFGNQQQKKNPLLFWKFDEGNGLTASDTSGKGNHGTISGATWQNKDVCLFEGNCLKFDGNDDYVRRFHDGGSDAWCNDTNALHGCTASWSARTKITFAGNVASSNLTDFPVLVKLDSTRIDYGKTQSAGQDIRFVDPNDPNTVLPHEVESFDESGTSYVWVKVPQIDGNSRTDYIWMYYGNSAPDGQQRISVWDTNYRSVFHLGETGSGTAGEFKDSSSVGNNGRGGNGTAANVPTRTAGKIGFSQDFDGTNDMISTPGTTIIDGTSAYTFEAWVNTDTCGESGDGEIFEKTAVLAFYVCDPSDTGNNIGVIYGANSTKGFSTTDSVLLNTWQHVAAVYNGSGTLTFYVNGNNVTSDSTVTEANAAGAFLIGAETTGAASFNFDGEIDEARASNTNRTSDWIKASYLSGLDQFVTFAPEGSDPKLDPGDDSFSVGAWFRHPATITGQDTIIARADAVNGVGYKMYFDATAGLCFGIDGTSGSFPSDKACSTNTYNDNQWHFVEAIKNGTTSITLYVDGQQVNQDTSITSSSLSGVAPPFYVGMDADGSSNGWDGYIDEVRVYDYARSAAEVKADYTAKGSVLGMSASIGITDPKSALNQGLVGYWKLDDGNQLPCSSGVNKACDSSGNGLVGTWNGHTASTSGKFGYAGIFDGTDDYINVSDPGSSSALDFTTGNAITLSAWVYPTSFSTDGAGTFISKGGTNANDQHNYAIGHKDSCSTTCKVSFYYKNSGNTAFNSFETNANILTLNTWQLVTVSYTFGVGSSIKVYVNGQLQNGSWVTGDGNEAPIVTNDPLWLGAIDYNGGGTAEEEMIGKLDDARIYNRALSPREVTNLYDWTAAPVAHFKLDERNGTTAYDSSGYDNDATLNNAPKWTVGKVGQALQFTNGSYADINQDALLNNVTDSSYSLSAWAYADSTPPTSGNGEFNYGILIKNGFHSGIQFAQDNTFVAGIVNSSNSTFTIGSSAYAPRQWHYVTQVVDDVAKTVSIYVDGKFEDSTAYTGSLRDYGTNSFKIGIAANGFPCTDDWVWCFDGRIDDVKIYNYVLSPKQITKDMNAGHPAVGSPIASALVHLKLDDGFGNVASNSGSCGSTCNAKLYNFSSPATYGSGWTNDGKFGKALNFDASNDYGSISDNTSLDITNEITISAWVKPTVISGFKTVLIKETELNAENYGLQMLASGKVQFNFYSGGYEAFDSHTALRLNKWQHIVATYNDAQNTVNIYIDGKLDATYTTTLSMNNTNNEDLWIGQSTAGERWAGSLDEIKIYNYSLNANEVKVEYNQGKALVLGSLSTDPDNITASNSAARRYCPPGNAETNCAGTGVLNPAPIGEWKLDDRKNVIAHDTSGNGNNGVLTSGPIWTGGRNGAGVSFDGIDDYIGIPHTTLLEPTNISVSAWYMPKRLNGPLQSIVSKANSSGWYLAQDETTGVLAFNVFVGGAYRIAQWTYGSGLQDGNWYHIEGTYDGSTVRLYVNGILQASTSFSGSISYGSSNSVIIGADAGSGSTPDGGTHFRGSVDDVRIYNYSRSQAQVAWDYNKGQPLAKYAFDECSGNTLHNYAALPIATVSASLSWGTWTGTGGTNSSPGTCGSASGSEAWANGNTGKFNSSLDFDGTDDQVIVTNNNFGNMGSNQDFTVAAWVKTSQTAAASRYPTILSKQRFTSQTGYGLFLHEATEPKWYGEIYVAGSGYQVYGASDVADGSWHHLVFQRSGSTLKSYQDGKLAQTVTAVTSDLSTGTNITMGRANDDNNLSYDGQLDDVMLFNYALSPAQIRVLYNQNAAVRFGPLTGNP